MAVAAPTAAAAPLRALCVAFDLDDTIWSMVDTIASAHAAMAERMSKVCPAMGEKCRSPGWFRELSERVKAAHPAQAADFTFVRKGCLRMAFEEFGVATDEAEVEACFSAFYKQRNRPHFFPGALSTLEALRKRGYRLGSITDGNADVTAIPELSGIFDFAVTAGEVGCMKPDRRIFERAIELAGCDAADILYIGDNFNKDVLGPVAAGMQAVWANNPDIVANPLFKEFHWGSLPEVPERPLSAAKAVVQSLPELLELLNGPERSVAGA